MSLETVRTEPGRWAPHWGQGATGKMVRVVVIGGTLGLSTFDPTTAAATRKPVDCAPSREWTNTGPHLDPVEPQAGEPSSASLIAELRRISGLTWQHLARLFNVERRSIHFWASGRSMSDANAEHLARIVAAIRKIDRGDPARTRAWLLAPLPTGELPLDLLQQRRYDDVVAPPIPQRPSNRPPQVSAVASANRLPPPPDQLLRGSEPSKPSKGRLLSSAPVNRVKRTE